VKTSVSRIALCAIVAWSLSMLLLATGCAIGNTQSEWIELFNGQDLTGFHPLNPDNSTWQVASKVELKANNKHQLNIVDGTGILVNSPKGGTSNLITDYQHGDCEAHIEFLVSEHSNSGIFFTGKYEIQILDSYGKKDVTFSDCGGIYARWVNKQSVDGHAPRVNASKPPGEWQSFDVIFKAPRFDDAGKKIDNAMFVKVMHNGILVHENVELKGPTRSGGYRGPEKPIGPLMLQGDHGPVAYRNLRIRPLN